MNRAPLEYDISKKSSTVAEAGQILVVTTSGSGINLGDSASFAGVVNNPSGYEVAGMVAVDVVSIDTTLYHRNFHNDSALLGEPVPLFTKGKFSTDKISSAVSAIGNTAYLGLSGWLRNTAGVGGTVDTPKVGKFTSLKDENGFAEVALTIPVV